VSLLGFIVVAFLAVGPAEIAAVSDDERLPEPCSHRRALHPYRRTCLEVPIEVLLTSPSSSKTRMATSRHRV